MQPRFGFGRARHRRPGLLYVAGVFALSATLITPSGIAVADQPEPVDDPASYVDPFIGTTNSGNVYPGAVLPFGMLSWSPTNTSNNQTSAPAAGGYQYNVPKTRGFSLTHMNGTGCTPGASGDIPIYPHVGDVTSSPSADSTDAIYASRWNRPGSFTPILGSISSRVLQITANAENPPNEIAVNLNDQSQSTKWLTFTSTGWVVYRLSEPVAVVRYALTSANDFQQRDPRNWTLQGSHDGVTWTVVDSQAGEVFASRFQTNQYEFDNDTAYLYYKLDVTLNGGTNIVQLAELQLSDGDDTPPPPPPADVEVAEPGYYKVDLNSGVRTELTTTMRTGSGRFTFPAGEPANLLFRVSNSLTGSVDATVDIDVANNLVSGSVDSGGFCGGTSGGNVNRRHYYSLYFVAEFDHPFTSYGTWVDANLFPGTTSASGGEDFTSRAGRGSGGYVGFDTSQDETVNVRVGISYVSVDNAKENLDAENPPGTDFDTLRADAYETWRNQLDRIKVSGGTDDQRTIFYTALYHALLQPSLFNDVNGEYSGSDLATHTLEPGQGAQYGTFSGWDVYRGQVQMLAFLEPEVAADYAQSLFNFAKQRDGEWDRWLHNQGKTGVMAGDPSAPTVAGMYAFGATDFDVHGALDSLVTAATVPTANDNSDLGCAVQCVGQRPSLDRYLVLGYVPNDNSHSWGSVGETLEDAVVDYVFAGLAYWFGDIETYNEFLV